MKSNHTLGESKQLNVNMKKMYILTRPTPLSDLSLEDLDEAGKNNWRERARDLRMRRERALRHQLI